MKNSIATWTLLNCIAVTCLAHAAGREEVLIADFEGKDYGNWKATGEAFGPRPGPGHAAQPNARQRV